MHELSLSSAIVNTVVKHAAGRRVVTVDVRVGGLRQVVPDTLSFYFAFVARGTVCEDAELMLSVTDPRLGCGPCGREWAIEVPDFRCPSCDGRAEIVSGNEFEVDSIEVVQAEREAECIAPG